jgi:DNA-binding transcriptional MerR regulator
MGATARTGTEIPDRKYFRIGEAAGIVGVESHVLRYWESEFPMIRPHRGPSRQRLYRRRDVELFVRIRELVHEQGFTLAGARKVLAAGGRPGPRDPASALRRIREELEEMRKRLSQPP